MIEKRYTYYYSPIGRLVITEDGKGICLVTFSDVDDDCIKKETDLLLMAVNQLEEYFMGARKNFDLPLSLKGTEFQLMVWKKLLDIPYGETVSYSDIANSINKPKAVRAVGMANNKNKIPIIIPCHRVIGKDGSLTGYAGGLDIKKQLLDMEKKYLNCWQQKCLG